MPIRQVDAPHRVMHVRVVPQHRITWHQTHSLSLSLLMSLTRWVCCAWCLCCALDHKPGGLVFWQGVLGFWQGLAPYDSALSSPSCCPVVFLKRSAAYAAS
jgi:hypothetical protein